MGEGGNTDPDEEIAKKVFLYVISSGQRATRAFVSMQTSKQVNCSFPFNSFTNRHNVYKVETYL